MQPSYLIANEHWPAHRCMQYPEAPVREGPWHVAMCVSVCIYVCLVTRDGSLDHLPGHLWYVVHSSHAHNVHIYMHRRTQRMHGSSCAEQRWTMSRAQPFVLRRSALTACSAPVTALSAALLALTVSSWHGDTVVTDTRLKVERIRCSRDIQ